MDKSLSKKDVLNDMYVRYNLNKESDIHEQVGKNGSVMFRIITRTGIEKIAAGANIDVTYQLVDPKLYHPLMKTELVSYTNLPGGGETSGITGKSMQLVPAYQVAMIATGVMKDDAGNVIKSVQTFGEASEKNCRSVEYIFAMAEKRALSRAVLKLAGLYSLGFYGEDEADDFGDTMKAKAVAKSAQIKG